MPSHFGAEGSHDTATETILGIIGSTTIRPSVYYVMIGSESAAADARIIVEILESSGAGAGTTAGSAPTPKPLDGDDRVALATTGHAYTAEPTTYVAQSFLKIPFIDRSLYQFFGREGGEFTIASVANALIGARIASFSAGTPTISCTMHWKE